MSRVCTIVDQYRHNMLTQEIEDADPHRIIQLLMQGVIDKLSAALHFLSEGKIAERGEQISRAIAIIGALQNSLDFEQGGNIAKNLDALYDYMSRTLLQANREGDVEKLSEVVHLMSEIKVGWDGIPEDMRAEHAERTAEK